MRGRLAVDADLGYVVKELARGEGYSIHLIPGDTISVVYHEDLKVCGRSIRTSETEIVSWKSDRELMVDTAIVVELDDAEAAALGLTRALGGILGSSSWSDPQREEEEA